MKILVVDDSTTMRRILVNILNNAGYAEVDQACDGEKAVAAVTAGSYDCVLMDWNMPNMLGIDALRLIRGAGYSVPVIMVTTEAEKSRVMEALKSGANNYIIKPFTPDVVVSKLRDIEKTVSC